MLLERDQNFAIMGGGNFHGVNKLECVSCSCVRFLEVWNKEFPGGTENDRKCFLPPKRGEQIGPTPYISNMDVRSNQWWSTTSTMTSQHHLDSTVTQNCQYLTLPCWCNRVRVHLYANRHHWKVLKHYIFIQYGCKKQSKVVYSLNDDIIALFTLGSDTNNCQYLTKPCQCNRVRVHSYAHRHHWKVLNS